MSKLPVNPPPQIRTGAVIGSESLPFESMIFSNDPQQSPVSTAPNQGPQRSHYIYGPEAGRKVVETPTPVISKLFRPKN
jgi:hypothetical protein